MIDTHAHLNFPQLTKIIDQVVSESKAAGVTHIIIASSNLKDSIAAVDLAKKYLGFLYTSVGIHPQNTDPENNKSIEDQLKKLDDLLSQKVLSLRFYVPPLIVAIGETGLDFTEPPPGEEKRSEKEQETLFQGQIILAQKYNLPLLVHARSSSTHKGLRKDKEAVDEVIEILTMKQCNQATMKGVFHCYAGGKKRIPKILNLSGEWYFGFDGNLTYDEGLQNIIQLIPPERLLIETDSPFLAPVPHRGEVNTPAYLPLIQQKINDILGKDLTKQIEENSQRLFCL